MDDVCYLGAGIRPNRSSIFFPSFPLHVISCWFFLYIFLFLSFCLLFLTISVISFTLLFIVLLSHEMSFPETLIIFLWGLQRVSLRLGVEMWVWATPPDPGSYPGLQPKSVNSKSFLWRGVGPVTVSFKPLCKHDLFIWSWELTDLFLFLEIDLFIFDDEGFPDFCSKGLTFLSSVLRVC